MSPDSNCADVQDFGHPHRSGTAIDMAPGKGEGGIMKVSAKEAFKTSVTGRVEAHLRGKR